MSPNVACVTMLLAEVYESRKVDRSADGNSTDTWILFTSILHSSFHYIMEQHDWQQLLMELASHAAVDVNSAAWESSVTLAHDDTSVQSSTGSGVIDAGRSESGKASDQSLKLPYFEKEFFKEFLESPHQVLGSQLGLLGRVHDLELG